MRFASVIGSGTCSNDARAGIFDYRCASVEGEEVIVILIVFVVERMLRFLFVIAVEQFRMSIIVVYSGFRHDGSTVDVAILSAS